MDPAGPSIHWTDEEPLLKGALALREEVFCEEQGVPRELEIDGLGRQRQAVAQA